MGVEYANNGTVTPWKKGEALTAARLNETVHAVNAQRGMTPPYQSRVTPRGTRGGGLTLANVISVHEKHLTCRLADSETDVEVARSYDARPRDTETRFGLDLTYINYNADFTERTATCALKPLIAEAQLVWPEYTALDTSSEQPNASTLPSQIWISAAAGQSGVSEAPDWMEVSNREWRRKP